MQNKINHGSLNGVLFKKPSNIHGKIKAIKCKENMNRQESNNNNPDKKMD